mgnify:FL=1
MMELLEKLSDWAEDELSDVTKYTEESMEVKEKHSELSDTLQQIASQEEKHYEMLMNSLENIAEKKELSSDEKAVYCFIKKRLQKMHDRVKSMK